MFALFLFLSQKFWEIVLGLVLSLVLGLVLGRVLVLGVWAY